MLQKINDKVLLSDDPRMEFKHELASFQFYLTEIEKNIIIALYSEIDHEQTLNSTIFTKRISFGELAKICGLTTKDYSKIKRAVWSIFTERYVREIGADKLSGWHWLTNVEINQEGKYVDFDWNPKIVDLFLFDAKEGLFISAKRDILIKIKGDYAYRFYLWFRQWINNRHEKIFTLRHIADALDLPKSYYNDKYPSGINAGQIKGKIIEPALAKLANSDIQATSEYIRNGRHIESVKFRFWWRDLNKPVTTDTTACPVEEPTEQLSDEQQNVFDAMVALGLTQDDATKLLQEKPLEEIRISINYVKKKVTEGKVKNIKSYAYSAIKDGYGVAEARIAKQEEDARRAKDANKLENMPALQKEIHLNGQALADEARKGNIQTKTDAEIFAETKKAEIKAEFLGLDRESQENFLKWLCENLAKDTDSHKIMFGTISNSSIDDILDNGLNFSKLIGYTYILRYPDNKIPD